MNGTGRPGIIEIDRDYSPLISSGQMIGREQARMTRHDFLTYKEAAERFQTSRSKVTRAVKSGSLISETQKRNGRETLVVRLDHLERWSEKEGLRPTEVIFEEEVVDRDYPVNSPEQPRSPTVNREQSEELHDRLLDRLEQFQRRSIVLELQLQQTQRLLCENNESQHEKEARALEAEAKALEFAEEAESAKEEAELAKQEAAQAKIELESLKTEASASAEAKEQALQLMAADLHKLKTELREKEEAWAEARKPWWKKMWGRKSS